VRSSSPWPSHADAAGALLRSLGAPVRTGPKGTGALTQREAEVLQLIGDLPDAPRGGRPSSCANRTSRRGTWPSTSTTRSWWGEGERQADHVAGRRAADRRTANGVTRSTIRRRPWGPRPTTSTTEARPGHLLPPGGVVSTCSTDQPLRHRSSSVLTLMPVRCDHSARVSVSPYQVSGSPRWCQGAAGSSLGDP
jgi:hypothetical protein